MSSNSEIHVAPALPPPVIETKAGSTRATSTARLFGRQGFEILRKSFEDLCSPSPELLAELTQPVAGDPVKLRIAREKLAPLFGWKRSKLERDVYCLSLSKDQIPSEAARVGVKSAEVQVCLGDDLLRTRLDFTARGGIALGEADRQRAAKALQRAVNVRVNQVLAVTVRQRMAEKLRQRLSPAQKLTVRGQVANNCTFRIFANHTVS